MTARLTEFLLPTTLTYTTLTDNAFCSITCNDYLEFTGAYETTCINECTKLLKNNEFRAHFTRPGDELPVEMDTAENKVSLFQKHYLSSKENNTESFSALQITDLFKIIKPLFIIPAAFLSFHSLKKIIKETHPSKLITDIALATMGTYAVLSYLPLNWNTSLLVAMEISAAALLVRIEKCFSAPVVDNNTEECPCPGCTHRKKHFHKIVHPVTSRQSFEESEYLPPSSHFTERQKITTLTQDQEEELCKLLQKARLDPKEARPSLASLQKKILANSTDSDPFTSFKYKVKELVDQHCALCRTGNDFTGDCFTKTLTQCPKCRAVMYCRNQACQKALWTHRKNCRPTS